ncbi:MAG: hypothetical protein WCQ70_08635 [Lentimicrobiaceae bacterium]
MKTLIKSFTQIKKLFFPLLTIILLGSCCKDAETFMVPENFKQYFYFPAGSYWVYKNQFGAYDTLTLLSTDSKISKMHAESCDEYEKITANYISSNSGKFNISTTYISDFMLCELNKNYFTELTDFATYTNGEQKAQSCSSDIEWWIEDTIVVNKKNYYDVVVNKTTSFIPPSILDFPIKGYFKENIGLVKRELQNGEIWELIDYKINK